MCVPKSLVLVENQMPKRMVDIRSTFTDEKTKLLKQDKKL
jgi:hypothetical protein